MTKEGLQNDLPKGVDIFKDPNARMKIPAIKKALKQGKWVLFTYTEIVENTA